MEATMSWQKKDQEAVKQESMEGDTMQETHGDDNSLHSV